MTARWSLSKAVGVLGAAMLFAAFASRSSQTRDALWPVVQACRVNHDLTGAAFPCLQVIVSTGADQGYVILKPPFGPEDFILAPTRKITGVEDVSLQAADAPNYFEDAWNARGILALEGRVLPERNKVALAVNSVPNRTQDQLHIHIGCVPMKVSDEIQAIAPSLTEKRWQRLQRPIGGLSFWALRIDQETLAGVNPFRLASERFPGGEMRSVSIFVTGTQFEGGSDGFIIFATNNDRLHQDLLDESCSS
jgi:CDP-diacylglycerol pyrophosphatase